jgi:hypothetical protein
MHAGFSQFAAFDQDAIDNKAFVAQGKLTMPVLAVGGEKSFGSTMAVVMRAAATDVQEQVILVIVSFRSLADGGTARGHDCSRACLPRRTTLTIASRVTR